MFTPTDRFAPRDYLNVVDTGVLPVTAARVTYGTQSDTLDLILSPRLTPSRVPLLNQRWAVLPQGIPVHELDPAFPGGPQFGARWNHIGAAAEYSFSFYNGHDNLPLFHVKQNTLQGADLQPFYPQMRMYGADVGAPLGPLTLKGEAAYFTSTNPEADDYALFVLQLERQAGEWSLVAGYAGEVTTVHRGAPGFSPVRGLARSIVAHAGYTIDVNRSLAFEAVVHQNGQGLYAKTEYSQAFGQHWRATAGLAVLRGDPGDFLGQYRLNSHAILTLRYSF